MTIRFSIIALLIAPLTVNAAGLLGDKSSALGKPINGTAPSPKISIVDMTDRTNQEMTVYSMNQTQAVFDESDPTDNTLIVSYAPNRTIKVRVREFMGSLIVLPKGDRIKLYKLGDETNFSFKPSIADADTELPNSGSVETLVAGADTSLHIIGTSGNIYTFYLRGDTWDSEFSPTMKVLIQDEKLLPRLRIEQEKQEKKEQEQKEQDAKFKPVPDAVKNETPDYLEEVPFDPAKMDYGYRIKGGNEKLRPYVVFSDGQFTYFRFAKSESVADVKSFPAIFRVADGSDVPTNTSAMGSTLRVEGVANNWTLRLGNEYLCIEKIEKLPAVESAMNAVLE
jgi:ComB9 competence protein